MTDKPLSADPEVQNKNLDKISDEVLALAYDKALLYAHRKLRAFHNSGLLSKLDAYDVTNDAVVKTLAGDRPWNREKSDDLFVHLAGCISSIISNAYTSADFQQVERRENSEEVIAESNINERSIESIQEFESKITFLLDYIVSLRDDVEPVAKMMFKDGITEPSEIAQELGMRVSEVNSKKLAIRRMMLRTDFLLHYISNNRLDLISISLAIYKNKIVDAEGLSETLQISKHDARIQRTELNSIVRDIYRGII